MGRAEDRMRLLGEDIPEPTIAVAVELLREVLERLDEIEVQVKQVQTLQK